MTCPICKKDTAVDYRPFCSRRCADIDLAKWLNADYAIPTNEPADPDAPEEAAPPPARPH